MKNLLILLAVFCVVSIQAQSELSLHFMDNLIQSNATNPAIQSPYKINISLPSVYWNAHNSGFKNELLFQVEDSKLIVDPTRAIEKMENTGNLFQTNFEISFLSVAFKVKKFQISLFHNIHFDAYFEYPKGLVQLAWNGNAAYIGETLEIAPTMDMWLYNEYGVGVSYPINEKLSIGGRLKLLNGYLGLNTERSQASLYTDPDYYQMQIQSEILLNTSGFNNFLDSDNDEGVFSEDGFDSPALAENKGFGLDLGVQYQLNENIKLSASIIDIGSIKWQKNVINNYSEGSFNFDGVEVKPFDENDDFNFDTVRDSVENIFDFQETAKSFSTTIPNKYYLSAVFKNEDNLALGAVIYGENYRGNFKPNFGISINKQFKDVFSIGTMVSLPSHGGFNFGLNGTLKVWAVQLYMVSDNILPIYDPLTGKNFNIRAGINIAINGKKDETETLESPPTPSVPTSGTRF